MLQLKSALLVGPVLALLTSAVLAQTSRQSTVIENTVALQNAQSRCGFSVNYDMLGLALSAAQIRSEDLVRGGKFWASVERNQLRVRSLVDTEAGRASFCRNVKRDLSAMFD